MLSLFLFLAQAAASAPLEASAATQCQQRSPAGEIVVCAPRREGSSPYRISQPLGRQRRDLPKAEVQLTNGVRASAEAEQVDVGGFPSERVMVRLKIGF